MVKEVPIYAVVFCCFIFPTARSEASCRIPKAPENGSVQVIDEPKVGTLAHYTCDVNATLVGESISTCLPSGIWSSDAPKCLRSCYVPEIEDGQVGKYEWKNQFTRKIFISFPVGKSIKHHEKVIILCKDEYIPGNQETGRSQEVECIDGSWTDPLFCRPKVSCEMPEAPKHGSVQLSDKLKVGTLAFFSCVDGATLVGVTTTKCLPSGKWSFDPPTCLLSCRGSPPVVENADAVILNDKDGEKVTYQCNEGFEKFKEETVVCDSGIWKGNLPACRRIFCLDSPPTIENAHVVSVVSKHEGRVTYRCDEDFEKIENETVVCDFGTWKGNPPICKRKYLSCDPFPASSDIDVIYTNGVRVKSIARFTCLNGTSLIGSQRARCLSNAKWSHPMPRCEENCTVPVLPHGDMRKRKLGDFVFNWRSLRYERESYEKIPSGNVISNNVSVTLFCPRKYFFQGTSLRNAEITCVKGLWKPNPVCLRDYSCDHFPISPKLTIHYSNGVQVGSVAFFRCLNSTSWIRSPFVTCLSNGSWSHSLPSCEENCTVPVLPHGDMRERKLGDFVFSWRSFRYERQESYEKIPSGNVISNNVTVTLFCSRKYVFQGTSLRNAEITCVKGLWEPNPVCVRDYSCDHFPESPKLTIRYTKGVQVGSVAFFRCLNSTSLIGGPFATCLSNGSWSHSLPSCEKNCTVPVLPHGDMRKRKIGHFVFRWRSFRNESQVSYEKISPGTVMTNNSSLMLFCPPQYSFKGTSLRQREITCINGLWNPDPVCTHSVVGCSKPATDPDSSVIFTPHKEVYKIFEMVTFSCPRGMRLTSQTQRIMCLRYVWSENVLPNCQ